MTFMIDSLMHTAPSACSYGRVRKYMDLQER